MLIKKEGQILLGMKKYGFDEGKWNGIGGKVQEADENIEVAAIVIIEKACLEEVAEI